MPPLRFVRFASRFGFASANVLACRGAHCQGSGLGRAALQPDCPTCVRDWRLRSSLGLRPPQGNAFVIHTEYSGSSSSPQMTPVLIVLILSPGSEPLPTHGTANQQALVRVSTMTQPDTKNRSAGNDGERRESTELSRNKQRGNALSAVSCV